MRTRLHRARHGVCRAGGPRSWAVAGSPTGNRAGGRLVQARRAALLPFFGSWNRVNPNGCDGSRDFTIYENSGGCMVVVVMGEK